MEGHLGTPGGLEIPTGSQCPGSRPQTAVLRLPLQRGKVRLTATEGRAERAVLVTATVQALYPLSLRPALGPGAGPA